MHPHANGAGDVSDHGSREQRQNRMLGGGKRVAAQISQSSQESSEDGPGPADRERFEDGGGGAAVAAATAAEGGGRGVPEREEESEFMMTENARNGSGNSRKRPRTGEDDRRFTSVKPDPELLVENGNMGGVVKDGSMVPRVLGGGDSRAMYRGAEPLPRPPRPLPLPPPGVALGSNGMDNDDGAAGAGEMTVVAVRTSLLRNRADEGPIPDEGEWEMMVRKFIRYVEGLEPGPTQEELSLMFAAALDPTLVRMRAANNALIELAELCALPDPGLSAQDEEDDGDDDFGGPGGPSPFPRQGFKVRLELDAEEPPPEGVQFLLKTVSAARGTVEAAARARACVTAAGDTLGGLHELKADYKRSLPPGPREPIQSIIEEEQARVRGYATAHEDIEAHRLHELRLRGRDVGEAYRRVEGEPGWSDVKRQVRGCISVYFIAERAERGGVLMVLHAVVI